MADLSCWNIKNQIFEFSKKNNQCVRMLSQEEQEDIHNRFTEKYIRKGVRIGYSIFEALKYEYAGVDVPDSWRWIKDFLGNNSVIVFFNKSDEKNYYEFISGERFVDFYENIPLIEFYIVDLKLNFLLAYNHSQCLVAMGMAADWLENDIRYVERYKKR